MKKAFSGIDAINVMKETYSPNPKANAFKAIFMDYNMPIMDGIECTKRLKVMMNEGKIPYVPIIAITANPAREVITFLYYLKQLILNCKGSRRML